MEWNDKGPPSSFPTYKKVADAYNLPYLDLNAFSTPDEISANNHWPHPPFAAHALHAALALCEHVDVYGAGLFSSGVTGDKIYAHAYDEQVGTCLERGSRAYEFGNVRGLGTFFSWRRDRIRTEILLHVLHALGVVRWVQ